MDLLFGCVEGQVADVEGCRVLELVLDFRCGASLVVVAVSSALLLVVSVGMEFVCSCADCADAPLLWRMSLVCPGARLCF